MQNIDSSTVTIPFIKKRFMTVIDTFDIMDGYRTSSNIPILFDFHTNIRDNDWNNDQTIPEDYRIMNSLIENIDNVYPYIQKLNDNFKNFNLSSAERQISLIILSTSRIFQCILSDILLNLNNFGEVGYSVKQEQIDRIKKMIEMYTQTCEEFESVIADSMNFTLDNSKLENFLHDRKLTSPIRICIEDDDTGKFASCLEIPQVYGFGETEDEALQMLYREIFSIYSDMQEDLQFSDEYQLLKHHLDLLLGNEKQNL